jgi:hypothetical protein
VKRHASSPRSPNSQIQQDLSPFRFSPFYLPFLEMRLVKEIWRGGIRHPASVTLFRGACKDNDDYNQNGSIGSNVFHDLDLR